MTTTTISTQGISAYNTQQVMNLKNQLQIYQQQLTTGKISTSYDGIAAGSNNLLSYQNTIDQLQAYQTANTVLNLNVTTATQTVSSMQKTMTDFAKQLTSFGTNATASAQTINQLQQFAFNALKAMEAYLNTDVNGQYIFGGTQTNTQPFSVGANTLDDFQKLYNGSTTAYSSSRAGDVSQFTADVSKTGDMTFNASNGTISAANKGQFANLPVGTVITVTGSNGSDGRYTVAANDGTTLTLGPAVSADGSATTPIPAVTTDAQGHTNNVNVYYTAPDTITSTTAGGFSNLAVGSTFNISGSSAYANNSGGFVVASNDGTTLTIKRAPLAPPPAVNTSLATGSDSTATVTSGGSSLGATNVAFTAPNQITLTPPGATSSLAVNSVINVNSPGTMGNSGAYIVTGIAGGTLTVQAANTTSLITETGAAGSINPGTGTLSTGTLNIDGPDGLIQASTAGSLSSLKVGQSIAVSGTSKNNGNYQVIGTYNTAVQNETAPSAATVSAGTTTIANATSGTLTFNAAASPPTVSAANANAFANVSVGQVINVAGTGANNGQFVVVGIDPTNHQSLQLAPAGTVAKVARSVSVSTTSMFKGDDGTTTQYIDAGQANVSATSALDPAFEKAIRAMALIAEGDPNGTGSLANNKQRVSQALYLVNDALTHTTQGAPPMNNESTRSLQDVTFTLAVQAKTLNDIGTQQTTTINNMQKSSASITQADTNQVIMQLLSQQNALQASYQAISRTQTMNLLDYLK